MSFPTPNNQFGKLVETLIATNMSEVSSIRPSILSALQAVCATYSGFAVEIDPARQLPDRDPTKTYHIFLMIGTIPARPWSVWLQSMEDPGDPSTVIEYDKQEFPEDLQGALNEFIRRLEEELL